MRRKIWCGGHEGDVEWLLGTCGGCDVWGWIGLDVLGGFIVVIVLGEDGRCVVGGGDEWCSGGCSGSRWPGVWEVRWCFERTLVVKVVDDLFVLEDDRHEAGDGAPQ